MDSGEERLLQLDENLLQATNTSPYTGDGSVDSNGEPVLRHNSGGWRACLFILGTEGCERLAYYGIAKNLVTYLTQNLHEGNVSAARNVAAWQGTCYVSPLIGAVLADTYWGRYWSIAVFASIYFIGMATLTLSASISAFRPPDCEGSICPRATPLQNTIFFFGLYVIALGTGGIKPCVAAFGADQFDDSDHVEKMKRGSFYNWFFFSINIGAFMSSTVLVWIQDNVGWGLGFGIPTLFMGVAIGSLFAGTRLFRFQKPGGSPLTRMCQVLVASFRKFNTEVPPDSFLLYELSENFSSYERSGKLTHTEQYKFLDKAAVVSDLEIKSGNFSNPWRLCTVTQVEELKILIRMFPIWATTIMFFTVYGQMSTMFVEQGKVMDTAIGSFTVPPASLSTFDVLSIIALVPIYDKLLVPFARKFTGKERGFSDLQRMGIGLFISSLSMITAALVERKRLEVARALDLVDNGDAVPMSILWQIPQYLFVGTAEVFTWIGQLEFFYDQSPDAMRSLFNALALLTTAFGNYLNSFVLTIVTVLTTKGGKPGWIPDNLNEGNLDYYFWLLAGLSIFNLLLYANFSSRYIYKRAS